MTTRNRRKFFELRDKYFDLDEKQEPMVFQSGTWHELQEQKLIILDEMEACFK